MTNIFSDARRVLVWLGTASSDSEIAINCLNLVGSKIRVNWAFLAMYPVEEGAWADPNSILPFTEEQFWSILNLIQREWFERLWIWQEVLLANDDALVFCGSGTILWKALTRALFCMRRKPVPNSLYLPWAKRIGETQFLLTPVNNIDLIGARNSLGHLLEQTESCKCTDPRDKIFALRGLLREDQQVEIEPDYTKTVYEVYKKTIRKYISRTG